MISNKPEIVKFKPYLYQESWFRTLVQCFRLATQSFNIKFDSELSLSFKVPPLVNFCPNWKCCIDLRETHRWKLRQLCFTRQPLKSPFSHGIGFNRVRWYFYGAIEISFSHSVDNRNNGCQECCENQYCKDNHGDDEEKDLKSWRRGTAVIAV